jgi:integrase
MASLHKDAKGRSPFWICAFTDATGRRLKKSTRQTSKSKAMQVCIGWQRAVDMARQNVLTEDKAREVISEIMAGVTGGQGLRSFTTRAWFEHFCKIKSDAQNTATAGKYQLVKREFLEFLGAKADLNIMAVTSADVRAFRDSRRATGVSATTLNDRLVFLSSYFNGAWRDHVISNNPCTAVEPVKDTLTPAKRRKQPFTLEQVRLLLEQADDEWRGLILTGFYTGARIHDCANLRSRDVDMEGERIVFETYSKRGDEHIVPMHPALKEYFVSRKSTVVAMPKSDAYVFPNLAERRTAYLCQCFGRLMARAGIIPRKVREGEGGSRSASRTVNSLGFHSLRRSNVSLLANAGVPEEQRMAITAHATREVHKTYTNLELSRLREAVAVLPRI